MEEKEKKEDALKACMKEKEEYIELSKRLKADMVNFKNEVDRRMSEFKDFANEKFILEILPVLDSLELSLKYTPENLKDDNWVKGMVSIKGQLEGILKSMGLEKIKAEGEKFDPNLHEAVSHEESDKGEDVVIEEIQGGYKLNGKVIKAAKVKISK